MVIEGIIGVIVLGVLRCFWLYKHPDKPLNFYDGKYDQQVEEGKKILKEREERKSRGG